MNIGPVHPAVTKTDFYRPVHCLLGLPFDAINLDQAVKQITDAIATKRPLFISTPNLNFVIASQHDPDFRDSVLRSDLSVVDGMPLVWLSRLLSIPIRERVAGSDIFAALMRTQGQKLNVFFFGGPAGVAELACGRINEKAGSMHCVGFESPGFVPVEKMSSPETITRINESGADFLVVALGAAKGQAWIEQNRGALTVPVLSHLGAVVNFLAGTVSRAPYVFQKVGLEWLWRIFQEPTLWRRYLYDGINLVGLILGRVLPCMVMKRLSSRFAVQADNAKLTANREDHATTIQLTGAWSDSNADSLRDCFTSAIEQNTDISLDLGETTYLDDTSVGLLLLLYGHQTKLGRRVRVVNCSPSARRWLYFYCADFLYS